MLLAGILKFNSSLTKVEVLNMGLDDKAANDYYYAIKENAVLEHLDISGEPAQLTDHSPSSQNRSTPAAAPRPLASSQLTAASLSPA